jgi:hypothetical protein
MAVMLSGFLKGLATVLVWAVVTAAAVTLSWWGVHTVMAGTAYDPPRAVPIPSGAPRTLPPVASSTHRPKPTPTPTPTHTTPKPPPPTHTTPPPKKPTGSPKPSATPPDQVEDGVIRSYDTKGGRVVLDIGSTQASLVSATPQSGWSMQVWRETYWIRVDFTRDSDTVELMCDWYEKQPQVQIVETSGY